MRSRWTHNFTQFGYKYQVLMLSLAVSYNTSTCQQVTGESPKDIDYACTMLTILTPLSKIQHCCGSRSRLYNTALLDHKLLLPEVDGIFMKEICRLHRSVLIVWMDGTTTFLSISWMSGSYMGPEWPGHATTVSKSSIELQTNCAYEWFRCWNLHGILGPSQCRNDMHQ